MKLTRILGSLILVALTGCSAQLERQATADAQKQCAAQGKQFVTTDTTQHDNPIYSSASVAGVCVGPDDPRYVPPVPATPPKPAA
jgi:hypothetical protein